MNFLEMIIMSRKMTFVDGRVTLCGQDLAVFPPTTIAEYILMNNNDPKIAIRIYSNAKKAMLENKENFIKAPKESDKASWICGLINLYGLGKITYVDTKTAPLGIVSLDNSAIASELKGKYKDAVDHLTRGIVAGVASCLSDYELDAIETQCSAVSGNQCIIIIDSSQKLKSRFPEICTKQIG